jgi:hypothetical protein
MRDVVNVSWSITPSIGILRLEYEYIPPARYCQGMTILTRMNAKRQEDPKEVRGYIQSVQLFPLQLSIDHSLTVTH